MTDVHLKECALEIWDLFLPSTVIKFHCIQFALLTASTFIYSFCNMMKAMYIYSVAHTMDASDFELMAIAEMP